MARYNFLRSVTDNTEATEEPIDGVRAFTLTLEGTEYLFIAGGWNGFIAADPNRNSVYRSSDGINFTKYTAAWNKRHSFQLIKTSDNKVYVIGSDAIATTTATDRAEVWESSNGTDWTLVTNTSPFGDRVLFAADRDEDDNFYVFGGHQVGGTFGNWTVDSAFTDVWKSTDRGVTWTQIATGVTCLGGNVGGQIARYNGKFIGACIPSVYSATQGGRTYVKTCYSSTDGITWAQEREFSGLGRQYADMTVWDGLLWMVNGSTPNQGGNYNLQELWYWNGANWARIVAPPATATHATGITAFQDMLYICCGNLNQTVSHIEKYQVDEEE